VRKIFEGRFERQVAVTTGFFFKEAIAVLPFGPFSDISEDFFFPIPKET
jgi:hypothetical protein